MFDLARIEGKKFYHIAESFFLEDVIYKPDRFGSLMAFEYKASQLDGRAVVVKRFMDIVISLFALVVFSPLFVLIALAIKWDSS